MIRAISAHVTGRVRSIASTPSSIAALLVCAIISAFFWPSLTPTGTAPWGLDLGTPGPQREIEEAAMLNVSLAVIGVLWVGFFPMLLGMVIRPKATSAGRNSEIELGHPALPIPTRVRIICEAVTVMALIMVTRIPFVLWRERLAGGAGLYPENIAGPFALGALVLTPALLLVLGRSRALEYMFFGATVVGILVCAAMPLGLLETPTSLTLTMLPMCVAALWFAGRAPSRVAFSLHGFDSGILRRPAMEPESRMRLDFVVKSLILLVPFALAELLIMALYGWGKVGGMTFYLGSVIVYSLMIGFVVLRPMGSAQAIAGVWGKAGYQPGDFARAFSVLPVRRELVLRTVWLHAFVTGSLVWLAVILTGAFNARMTLGQLLFFTDSDGRFIGEIMLPLLAMIPCAAGFLVEGTAGNRKMAFFTGALFMLSPQIMFIMLIAGARATVAIPLMIAVAMIGGLPAFRLFRHDALA
jgi:hypothetical protein